MSHLQKQTKLLLSVFLLCLSAMLVPAAHSGNITWKNPVRSSTVKGKRNIEVYMYANNDIWGKIVVVDTVTHKKKVYTSRNKNTKHRAKIWIPFDTAKVIVYGGLEWKNGAFSWLRVKVNGVRYE